jgi:hypothetical protein
MQADIAFQQLTQLLKTFPDLKNAWNTPDARMWVARAAALVERVGKGTDYISFTVASDNLGSFIHDQNVQQITSILFRCYARLELVVPPELANAFIPVAEPFAALAALQKVFSTATSSAFIVDPYACAILLTDYAVLLPSGVHLKVLADQKDLKPSLKPAAQKWVQQYSTARPLEVRISPPGTLHDRLIFIDNKVVWSVGQSFNGLAKRSPTSLEKSSTEIFDLKAHAYGALWANGTPLH